MDNIRSTLSWWVRRALDIVFDTLHGVDTSAVIPLSIRDAPSAHREAGFPYAYDRAPWRTVPRCLRLAGVLTWHDFTFADIGCGKGKALLSAMALPFAEVIGIEFSPYLCRISQRNIDSARWLKRKCQKVSIICSDAVDWVPPSGTSLIIFFYNPFSFSVMERVLLNIVNSHHSNLRDIYLIFYRMSTSLDNINKTLIEASNGSALNIASTRFRGATVNIYHLPATLS